VKTVWGGVNALSRDWLFYSRKNVKERVEEVISCIEQEAAVGRDVTVRRVKPNRGGAVAKSLLGGKGLRRFGNFSEMMEEKCSLQNSNLRLLLPLVGIVHGVVRGPAYWGVLRERNDSEQKLESASFAPSFALFIERAGVLLTVK